MKNLHPLFLFSFRNSFLALFLIGSFSVLQAQSVTLTSPCTGGQVTIGLDGTLNGKNHYFDGTYRVSWDGSQWNIDDTNGRTYYYNTTSTALDPPCFDVGTWVRYQCPFGDLTEFTGSCDPGTPPCADNDNDGFEDESCGGTDCNDNDENVNPGSSPEQTNVVYHNISSVTVYWSTIPGSTNYGLRYRLQGSNDPWTEGTSLRAYRRLFSLQPCTGYEVQYRNFISGGWNCWSESYYFTTPCARANQENSVKKD